MQVSDVGDASVRTVSSRVELAASAIATVRVRTMTGRVELKLAGNAPALMELRSATGHIENNVPKGEGGATINIATGTGSILVEHQ